MTDRLQGNDPKHLAERAMRQLSALTGFDRLTLADRQERIIVSAGRAKMQPLDDDLGKPFIPRIIAERDCEGVPMVGNVTAAQMARACFLAPGPVDQERMAKSGVAATMTLPLTIDGEPVASVRADHPMPHRCSAERRSVSHLFAERLVARMARHGWTP